MALYAVAIWAGVVACVFDKIKRERKRREGSQIGKVPAIRTRPRRHFKCRAPCRKLRMGAKPSSPMLSEQVSLGRTGLPKAMHHHFRLPLRFLLSRDLQWKRAPGWTLHPCLSGRAGPPPSSRQHLPQGPTSFPLQLAASPGPELHLLTTFPHHGHLEPMSNRLVMEREFC